MINVQFPVPQFSIKMKGGKHFIFDSIRRRWLRLTEEEWVRQNIVAYLVQTLGYPKESIALEKEILVNGMKKRFDILVYDNSHQPWLLVECKAPGVPLSEDVLQQALRYNLSVPVAWIVITNGSTTAGWKKEGLQLKMVNDLPQQLGPKQ